MCCFNNSYIFDGSKLRNNNPANVEFFQLTFLFHSKYKNKQLLLAVFYALTNQTLYWKTGSIVQSQKE